MEYLSHRIFLDMHSTSSQTTLRVKQGTVNRKLYFALREGGKPYNIEEDCTAIFKATKADGTEIFNDCEISGDTIIYELTDQTTSAEGLMECEVSLYDGEYNEITSPTFTIIVDGKAFKGLQVVSETEANGLVELITGSVVEATQRAVIVIPFPKLKEHTSEYTDASMQAVKDSINKIIEKSNPVILIRTSAFYIPASFYRSSGNYIFVGLSPDTLLVEGNCVKVTYIKYNSRTDELEAEECVNIGSLGSDFESIEELNASESLATNDLVYKALNLLTITPEKVIFPEDLYTTYSFGNVKVENGEMTKLLDGGSTLKDFVSLLVTVIYPETTEPSVSLSFASGKAYEVGSTVAIQYSASLSAGAYTYGPETGVVAESWTITDTNGNENTAPDVGTGVLGTFPDLTVGDDTNYTITAVATHGEGAVPLTNTKVEYPEGKIAAGTKKATSAAITGYRSSFYGTVTSKNEITSSIIRGLAKSGNALKNGSSFTVAVPIGAMRVIIAYPATLRDVTSIKDVNGLNAEISSGFTKATVDVEGANGYTAKSYKVYYMDFANANDKANKFTVTI